MKQILWCTIVVVIATANSSSAQTRSEPPGAPPVADNLTPGEPSKPTRSRRAVVAPAGVPPETAQWLASLTISSKTSRGDSIPPVIMRYSEPDPQGNAELEQGLYVMARVLSRMLERADRDHVEHRLGVPILLTGAGKSVRPMYIEGIGPLFMIKVNFPLMSAPKAAPVRTTKQKPDSEWYEAERELYGTGTVDYLPDEGGNTAYNEEQVQLLKREIITALKEAANIRGIKPDEFLSVAVFGQSAGRGRSAEGNSFVEFAGTAAKGTVMTLRVRKSDIDGFAEGKVDYDGFKARVGTATYIGSGAGMTSINSWLQDSDKTRR
jgi:hypothetical protein